MTDGKMTPKPSDNLVKKLAKRAKDQTALVREMNSNDKATLYALKNKPSPSEKRSKAWKKRLRSRDGYKIKEDFKEPEPVKGEFDGSV
jgi:hypothetical protein